MKKKTALSNEERELFREAVDDIRPLKIKTRIIHKKSPQIKKPTFNEQEATLADLICEFADDEDVASVQSDEALYFHRSGVQHRILVELQRGEMRSEAELDLHGLNQEQAHQALHRFLMRALERHWRCVRIIHGKGGRTLEHAPILKNKVNQWLRRYEFVLAFCSAKASEGGTGSVYVLLKRSR
jgi:DNA-nicking Smr family endonuclease